MAKYMRLKDGLFFDAVQWNEPGDHPHVTYDGENYVYLNPERPPNYKPSGVFPGSWIVTDPFGKPWTLTRRFSQLYVPADAIVAGLGDVLNVDPFEIDTADFNDLAYRYIRALAIAYGKHDLAEVLRAMLGEPPNFVTGKLRLRPEYDYSPYDFDSDDLDPNEAY